MFSYIFDFAEYEEHLRYRRQVTNPNPIRPDPRQQEAPILRREDRPSVPFPQRPLEFNPVPPVDLDLAEAGSDAYGHHGGYKKGRVSKGAFILHVTKQCDTRNMTTV